jgi:lipopolysaccharide/colanic/teichoic acid biosynthesis glycosyltransferase
MIDRKVLNDLKTTQRVLDILEKGAKNKVPVDKRIMDIIISLVLIFFFAPAFIIAAILIKLTSRGPIIFKQTRLGLNGRPFEILKFRTMRTNMQDDIHRAFMKKVIEKQKASGGGQVFKMKNDPRVTLIGKILRKTSLDELPQLFNVLKGEMSIIGPRPPLAYEVECYKRWQLERLTGLPGITGLWQVSGRNHTDFETMVKQDIEYIRNRNLALDIKILLKTAPAMLKGY